MFRDLTSKIASFAISLALLIFATAVHAQQEELVRINMNNADIRNVIKWVSEQTNKNFIIDPRVKGRLSVLSNQPMTMDEAYQVFLTALDVYGFAVVESGDNVKVIPNAQARSSGLPIIGAFGADNQLHGELIIHVVSVENSKASDIVTLLRPLVPQTGHLAAFPSSNSVVIADRAHNIKRLVQLVQDIDKSGSLDVDIIPLEHADAKEVVDIIEPLFTSNKTTGVPLSFAVDARSNSILMTGTEQQRQDVVNLIDLLDKPLQGTGNTKVVYLNYIEAGEIKSVLEGLTGTLKKQTDGKEQIAGKSDVSIQVSETNNALIITASPSMLETIDEVIAELDIRRSQVLIEAIIAEVSDSFSQELEVAWLTEPTLRGGVSAANLTNSSSTAALSASDQSGAFFQSGLTWGFFRNASLRAFIRAIGSDNESNILSMPSVITLDNEEAEVLVGSNVPFLTGSQTSAASTTSNPFQTITREDVGITLKVTPKVSKAGTITLDVSQEVESVRAEGVAGAQDLVTDVRSITTQVLIEDEDILVLGGLLDDRVSLSETKIPVLGDLPLLGRFFKSSNETIRKQNLMVFIKPTIIDNEKLAGDQTKEKYEAIRELQEASAQVRKTKRLELPKYDDLTERPDSASKMLDQAEVELSE